MDPPSGPALITGDTVSMSCLVRPWTLPRLKKSTCTLHRHSSRPWECIRFKNKDPASKELNKADPSGSVHTCRPVLPSGRQEPGPFSLTLHRQAGFSANLPSVTRMFVLLRNPQHQTASE